MVPSPLVHVAVVLWFILRWFIPWWFMSRWFMLRWVNVATLYGADQGASSLGLVVWGAILSVRLSKRELVWFVME